MAMVLFSSESKEISIHKHVRACAHLAFAFAMHLASIVFNGTRHTYDGRYRQTSKEINANARCARALRRTLVIKLPEIRVYTCTPVCKIQRLLFVKYMRTYIESKCTCLVSSVTINCLENKRPSSLKNVTKAAHMGIELTN